MQPISAAARFTNFRVISVRRSARQHRRQRHGRVLPRLRAMNGFAGLYPSSSKKPATITLPGSYPSCSRANAGRAAGLAASTAQTKLLVRRCSGLLAAKRNHKSPTARALGVRQPFDFFNSRRLAQDFGGQVAVACGLEVQNLLRHPGRI